MFVFFAPSNISFLRKLEAEDKKEEDDGGTSKLEDTRILVREERDVQCSF